MVFAACSASDKPATAPILPDPETPTPPPAAVAQVVTTVDADTLVLGDSTRAHVVLRSAAGVALQRAGGGHGRQHRPRAVAKRRAG